MYSNRNSITPLVFINIIVFGFTYMFCPSFVYYLALSPSWIIYKHAFWQFITYFFMHASFSHLLFNMLALYVFGTEVERRLGTKQFLTFYFLCGILSGVCSFVVYYLCGQNALLLGASGSIYGLLLLFSCLYPRSIVYVFGIIPIKAPVLVLVYFGIELLSQFANDGIAHITHLFGLLIGMLYVMLKLKMNPFEVWRRGY